MNRTALPDLLSDRPDERVVMPSRLADLLDSDPDAEASGSGAVVLSPDPLTGEEHIVAIAPGGPLNQAGFARVLTSAFGAMRALRMK